MQSHPFQIFSALERNSLHIKRLIDRIFGAAETNIRVSSDSHVTGYLLQYLFIYIYLIKSTLLLLSPTLWSSYVLVDEHSMHSFSFMLRLGLSINVNYFKKVSSVVRSASLVRYRRSIGFAIAFDPFCIFELFLIFLRIFKHFVFPY